MGCKRFPGAGRGSVPTENGLGYPRTVISKFKISTDSVLSFPWLVCHGWGNRVLTEVSQLIVDLGFHWQSPKDTCPGCSPLLGNDRLKPSGARRGACPVDKVLAASQRTFLEGNLKSSFIHPCTQGPTYQTLHIVMHPFTIHPPVTGPQFVSRKPVSKR